MIRVFRRADATLRGDTGRPAWGSSLVGVVGYGLIMGSFGGFEGERILQVVYSAIKLPMLLTATTVLALPSFFVLNTLLGLRADFRSAIRAVITSQAALGLILASTAPLTIVWYASTSNYSSAILFNGVMLGLSGLGAQRLLRRLYRPLIARDARHRRPLRAWLFLYAFNGIQLGWTLRPFLGTPDAPVRFFRGGDLENAYVIVARMIFRVLLGR